MPTKPEAPALAAQLKTLADALEIGGVEAPPVFDLASRAHWALHAIYAQFCREHETDADNARPPADELMTENTLRATLEITGAILDAHTIARDDGPNAVLPEVRQVLAQAPARLRLAADGIDGSASTNSPKRATAKGEWLARAMLAVRDHPDYSDAKIARECGVDKSRLSRSREYKVAAALARGQRNRPTGEYDRRTGRVEAVDEGPE